MTDGAAYSHLVAVDSLPPKGKHFPLELHADERHAVAEAFGLVALNHLAATIKLTPMHHGLVRLEGEMDADVTQSCVVTLEPVEEHVEATFERVFAPGGEGDEANGFAWTDEDEIELDSSSEDVPEPYGHGQIDIGAALVEQLSLEINPFPRVQGAQFDGYSDSPSEDDDTRPNPFAVLAKLKETESGKD